MNSSNTRPADRAQAELEDLYRTIIYNFLADKHIPQNRVMIHLILYYIIMSEGSRDKIDLCEVPLVILTLLENYTGRSEEEIKQELEVYGENFLEDSTSVLDIANLNPAVIFNKYAEIRNAMERRNYHGRDLVNGSSTYNSLPLSWHINAYGEHLSD